MKPEFKKVFDELVSKRVDGGYPVETVFIENELNLVGVLADHVVADCNKCKVEQASFIVFNIDGTYSFLCGCCQVHIYTDDKLIEPKKVFLGSGQGVALVERGPNDPHVCFIVIVEDDGNWFISRSNRGSSSFWLAELQSVLHEAEQWMKDNCINDGWGWSFKN